jgi:predicted O-methyltransferase YrrM
MSDTFNENVFRYSKRWFLDSEIKRLLSKFIDTNAINTVLEIGCYEGLSSVFFAHYCLNNDESTLTCIDPFLNIDNNDHKQYLLNNEETNFDYNISNCNNSHKIIVQKITSDDFFLHNTKTYNFIYIDGCHEPEYIFRDMKNSFSVLEIGGIMWMDDYDGGVGGKIKSAMHSFLDTIQGHYEFIHRGYQLAIRRLF